LTVAPSAIAALPGAGAGLVSTRSQYEHVFDIYVPIALGVFGLIALAVLLAVVRFRGRAPENAARWHEHNPSEAAYAVLLLLVVGFLLYVTFGAEHEVDRASAQEAPRLYVNVIGAKWEWHFEYPAYGINRYSGTVGHQALVVPTGEAIRFRLVSRDVIHEFWVPELRYKHDLIPGSVQQATLTFTRAGTFPGQCAEFCGIYHSRMTFDVQAVSPARFAAWTAEQRGSGR
jgi:cytochrome c oxidase subunit 2